MNKPFILNFVDYFKPEESSNEYTEYSSELNLNVLQGTKIPATCALNLEGETFTKANQDVTDLSTSIKARFIRMLEDETLTLVAREGTDCSIKESFFRFIQFLEGETHTRSYQESTDIK